MEHDENISLNEIQKKERLARRKELDDIRTMFNSKSGRNFVWRILEKCGTFESTFHIDPNTMGYLSGQQDIGHFVMSEIVEAGDSLLFKLMKENKKQKELEV